MKIIGTIETQRENWRKASTKYYAKNRSKILSRLTTPEIKAQRNKNARRYRLKYPDRVRQAEKKWRQNNRAKYLQNIRSQHLRLEYGITSEEYERLLDSQNGLCALCKKPPGKR